MAPVKRFMCLDLCICFNSLVNLGSILLLPQPFQAEIIKHNTYRRFIREL